MQSRVTWLRIDRLINACMRAVELFLRGVEIDETAERVEVCAVNLQSAFVQLLALCLFVLGERRGREVDVRGRRVRLGVACGREVGACGRDVAKFQIGRAARGVSFGAQVCEQLRRNLATS